MTAQIPDTYIFHEDEYRYVASEPRFDFTPRILGLEPEGRCTGCWRGFWCKYEISDKGFGLKNLYIHTKDDNYPAVMGIDVSEIEYVDCTSYRSVNGKWIETPSKTEKYLGHREYKNVHFPINYTGNILIGKNFLDNYYLHIGYQKFYTYKTLIEIVVTDGKIIKIFDRSEIAKLVREKIDATVKEIDYDTDINSIIKQVKEENSISELWWLK